MDKGNKRQFIHSLCNSVRDSLIDAVSAMPEEWDGHELRELIAHEFEWQASHNLLRIDRKRKRAFNKERVSRGIPDRLAAKDEDEVPPCAVAMGCLCAGHARGNSPSAACDTSE